MSDYVWPAVLSFQRAVVYSGKSKATLNRAIKSGALQVYALDMAPRGARAIERAALDRWLAGDAR
jgi:hypothetical protein